MSLSVADIASIVKIEQNVQQFRSSGATVLIFSAKGEVNGQLCEALNSLPDVRAAGALRETSPILLAALPQQSIPAFEVSPRFPLVFPGSALAHGEPGVILSRDAAATSSFTTGDQVNFGTVEAKIVGIYNYPQDGRARGYGFAALMPIPDGNQFDECWVDQWPQSENLVVMLSGVTTPHTGGAPIASTFSQLNSTHGEFLDGHSLFNSRITIWGLPLGFIAAFAIAFLAIRLRRLELASALHVGVPRFALMCQLLGEAALWLTPTIVSGALIAVAFAGANGGGLSYLTTSLLSAQIPAFFVLGVLIGTAAAALLVKESHLFRYFKERR